METVPLQSRKIMNNVCPMNTWSLHPMGTQDHHVSCEGQRHRTSTHWYFLWQHKQVVSQEMARPDEIVTRQRSVPTRLKRRPEERPGVRSAGAAVNFLVPGHFQQRPTLPARKTCLQPGRPEPTNHPVCRMVK